MAVLTNEEWKLLLLAIQANASEETRHKAGQLLNAKVDKLRMKPEVEAEKYTPPAPYPKYANERFRFEGKTSPYDVYYNGQYYCGRVKREHNDTWSSAQPGKPWERHTWHKSRGRFPAAIHLAKILLGDTVP